MFGIETCIQEIEDHLPLWAEQADTACHIFDIDYLPALCKIISNYGYTISVPDSLDQSTEDWKLEEVYLGIEREDPKDPMFTKIFSHHEPHFIKK